MAQDKDGAQPDPTEILKNLKEREPSSAGTADGEDCAPLSFRTIIRERATEDDQPFSGNMTLEKIIGGDILYAAAIRKQIWLIMLIVLFVVVYISNRYKCQQDLIAIDRLTSELKDAKYRALSSSSDLTQQTRESKVLEHLRADNDSTLHIATQPPYIIKVPSTEER